jgi:hypothetical protein
MERPDIQITQVSQGGKTVYNFALQGGVDPGSTVLQEFSEIVARHSLTPEGGRYEVNAITPDGSTVRFLGGMYVQARKYNAVLADLRARGYTIIP